MSSNGVFEHTILERPSGLMSMDDASHALAVGLLRPAGLPLKHDDRCEQGRASGMPPGHAPASHMAATWAAAPTQQGDSGHLASELESLLESMGYNTEGVPS